MTGFDWKNKLFFGDNLDILRNEIADSSVDLIYLDPPFNSNANYTSCFKSVAASSPLHRLLPLRTHGTGT